jgi:hypothetical protein
LAIGFCAAQQLIFAIARLPLWKQGNRIWNFVMLNSIRHPLPQRSGFARTEREWIPDQVRDDESLA